MQVACDNAKNGAARSPGRSRRNSRTPRRPSSELKARIDKTLEFLKTIKPAQIIGKEAGKVSLPFWEGKI